MRIKIKAAGENLGSGIYDGQGREIEVGAVFEVEAEPTAWAGRYEVLDGVGSADGKTFVANDGTLDVTDLDGRTVEELKAIAAEYEIDLEGATKKADIIAAIQLAAEPKA